MSGLAKTFEPLMKRAARTWQGMLSSELNKMGEFTEMIEKGIALVGQVPIQQLMSIVRRSNFNFRTSLHEE
jgi:hypothetical protein